MRMKDHEDRFGAIAIGKGYLSFDKLFNALNIKASDNLESRQNKDICTILHEQGHMNISQINEVLMDMDMPPIYNE